VSFFAIITRASFTPVYCADHGQSFESAADLEHLMNTYSQSQSAIDFFGFAFV